MATATTSTSTSFCNCSNSRLLLGLAGPHHHISFSSRLPVHQFPRSFILKCKPLRLGLGTQRLRCLSFSSSPVPSSSSPSPHPHPHPPPSPSPWDDKPYEVLPGGKKSYLDEQDVVTFLDPPTELVPLDPSSFNPASYLWKKVSDIPEERRHRLLRLLRPRLISAAWAISGTRYDDPQFAEKSSSGFLRVKEADASSLEHWNCRKSGGPVPFAWINKFKMALFHQDGGLYGRFIGGSLVGRMASPLYFSVQQTQEVMPTDQPCDLAYEFGDGLLDVSAYPQGFPRSAKHPWPFNDQLVVYVRHVGPGVMVGQAWQEGVALEQVPKKFCGEILMVKDYSRFS